jgi:predicted metal-dependent hydrolase
MLYFKKIFLKKRNKRKILLSSRRKDYLENKEKARRLVHQKIEYFNNFYGYQFNRISIKNQKTRWGSCSSKGNLNFNYRILFLPEELCNYVIVHELCHLKELNHSKNFWKLVSNTIDNCKEKRKELSKINVVIR